MSLGINQGLTFCPNTAPALSAQSCDQPDLVFSYQITPRTLCTTANIITVTQTQAEIQPYLYTKVADANNYKKSPLILITNYFFLLQAFKFFPKDRKMALVQLPTVDDAIASLVQLHNYQLSETSHLR